MGARSTKTHNGIKSRLVGAWTLVSLVEEHHGGEATYPFGPSPEGFLIYTPEGIVSAQLMRPGRTAFRSGNWHDGTPEQHQEAGDGYIAYCGSFVVDERNETVTHIPSVALLPNLIHEEQRRSVKLTGDKLTLSVASAADAGGDITTSHLQWQRVR